MMRRRLNLTPIFTVAAAGLLWAGIREGVHGLLILARAWGLT
jgi:hypothetical protein